MKPAALLRKGDGSVVAGQAVWACSLWSRTRGMIGRSFAREAFDAMVFEKCNAVHCCWMSEAVDVLFLDRRWQVVKCCSCVKPWRFAWGGMQAAITVELPAGTVKRMGIVPGEYLKTELLPER